LNLIQMKAVSMLDEDLAIPSTADPDAPPAVAALQVSASHPRLNKYGNIGNIPIIPDCPAYPEEYMLFLDSLPHLPGHLSKDITTGSKQGKEGYETAVEWVSQQGFDCYQKNIYTKNGEVHQGIPVYETGAASCKTACQFSAGSRCTIKMWRHGDYWSLGPSDLYATQPTSGLIVREATCLPSYDYNDMIDAAQEEVELNARRTDAYYPFYHQAATDCEWMTSFDGWGKKCVGVYRMNGPTPSPTPYPTPYPTPSPTPYPTQYPTPAPTQSPTSSPTTATTTTISLEGLNNSEVRVEVKDEETNNHECLSWCYSKKHKDKLWTGNGGKCKWYACSTCEECVPSPP